VQTGGEVLFNSGGFYSAIKSQAPVEGR